MKKLILVLLSLFLLNGCSTYEVGGLAEGLNRGILLSDPYYGNAYLNIMEQQKISRQLEDINRELQWQTHELRQQSFDSMFRNRDSFGLIK